MSKQLINLKGLKILEVEFNGDPLIAVKLKETGKIYVGINWITQAIGLTKGQHDNEVKKIRKDLIISKGASDLTLPTKGGNQIALCLELEFLPLWLAKISLTKNMKENHPEVVNNLIEYQLKAKDVLAEAFLHNEKEWDLHREVGKLDRRRETNAIKEYIPESQKNRFIYSNYTDLVYLTLFGKKAKAIRNERQINKKSDLTRDYLTAEELKLVDEAETIVTALVSLNFKYDYIKHQLQQKYAKKLN